MLHLLLKLIFMKILIYLFLITSLLISCEIVEPSHPEDYFKNGNTSPERSYYPTTFGTWWKYQLNSDSTAPYMLSTVGAEVQIDGNLTPIIENYYFFAKGIRMIHLEPTDVGSSDLVDYEIR